VSSKVGSVRNQGSELVEEIDNPAVKDVMNYVGLQKFPQAEANIQ